MDNEDDMAGDQEVDPELLLQQLLAVSGNERVKREVINKIVEASHLTPEQAELSLKTTIEVLIRLSRAN